MIQRIQTFYLLIALALMAIVIAVPYGNILLENGNIVDFKATGVEIAQENGDNLNVNTLPLMILLILSTSITLISILLFKKRMLQIRLSFLNIILMLGNIGVMYFFMRDTETKFAVEASYNVLMVFPLAAAILTFLAIRSIGKDEALVKSLDRIR